MTKRKIYVLLLLTLIIGGYFLYHSLMDSKEEVLNNKYYKTELDSIKEIRKNLKQNHSSVSELRNVFLEKINKKIFPYWYGTKWDFNGTTEMPNEGSIACGYFVTTTLRDMGVPINRVKMAQCASEEMINSLTANKNIYHLSSLTLVEFENKIKKLGKGLYIIGLDNHTGFISITEKGNYFIHSTGWFPFKVVKDVLSESDVISKSKYRVVGKISDDEVFLKKWVDAK